MPSSSDNTTFTDIYLNPLIFTGIGVTETDFAPDIAYDVVGFLNNPGGTLTFGGYNAGSVASYVGIQWGNFSAGVYGDPNGGVVSQTLTFTYNVATNAGGAILGFNGLLIADSIYGPSGEVDLNAVETISSGGSTIGTLTWTPAGSQGQWFSSGVSSASVTLTVTASINAAVGDTSSVNDVVSYSSIQQGFVAGEVNIDKQVSVDGGNTWQDSGNGTLDNPQAMVGCKVQYRAIITNTSTGGLTLTNASISDVNGPATPFTVGGQSTFTIAAGASVVTDINSTTAVAGHQVDTATVTATATDGTHSATVTASDQADYTGVVASVAIDKQVSLNGCTWYDVGNNVLQNPTATVGANVYYRTIITNTGSLAISGASVVDVGNGAPTITFGGASTTNLAAGQSITSDTAHTTALAGYQTDTATVTGKVSVSGTTCNVSASDKADYNGYLGSVTIDKQVSLNGCTWYDVGSNVLQNPTTLAGSTVYYRVVVTNTGTTAIASASVADVGNGAPSKFTFWGGWNSTGLAAGQSVTSDVVCSTALSGYQTDVATVTGTFNGTTGTVTASDKADYTGVPASISIDKQVSSDKVHWLDVGSGVLSGPTITCGGQVYFRTLVTDTGSSSLSNVSVTDNNGPKFTFGGKSSTSLVVGQTVTSDVSGITAVGGHNYDLATAYGTATVGGGTATVTASDQADYTGSGGSSGCGGSWGWGGNNCGGSTGGWGGGSGWGNCGGSSGSGSWGTGGWGCSGNSGWGTCGSNTNLCSNFGKAQQIEFCYSPSDCVSQWGLQSGLASVSGHDGCSTAFVVLSNCADPYSASAKCFFQGTVSSGQDIYANCSTATINGAHCTGSSQSFDHYTYAHVFSSLSAYNSHAAELQDCRYVTDGSQSIQAGDQVGCISVAGYVGTQGGHIV